MPVCEQSEMEAELGESGTGEVLLPCPLPSHNSPELRVISVHRGVSGELHLMGI